MGFPDIPAQTIVNPAYSISPTASGCQMLVMNLSEDGRRRAAVHLDCRACDLASRLGGQEYD